MSSLIHENPLAVASLHIEEKFKLLSMSGKMSMVWLQDTPPISFHSHPPYAISDCTAPKYTNFYEFMYLYVLCPVQSQELGMVVAVTTIQLQGQQSHDNDECQLGLDCG